MICCEPTIEPFTNQSTLSIPYSPFMINQYGAKPNVQVYYKEGTEYALSNDMSAVRFTGTSIEIDNGGNASGFVKIF